MPRGNDNGDEIGTSEVLLLRRRLAALERRVAELESAAESEAKEPALSNLIESERELPLMRQLVSEPEESYEPAELSEPDEFVPEPPEPPEPEREPVLMAVPYEPQVEPPPPVREGTFEQAIGLKLAGWLGGLVVVLGATLGVKYAYDAGWFQLIAPEFRLLAIIVGGFGLI
ncbi:MAG: hypothetical protein AAGI46_17125, partial [Planctomycetota bacterium]